MLDGAHNPDGAAAVARTLDEEFDVPGRRRWVLGMLAGRDPSEALDAFGIRPGDRVVACTPPSPRGLPAAELARLVEARGVAVEVQPDVAHAVEVAWGLATPRGRATWSSSPGSLYTVGAARTACRRLGLLG